MYVIDRRRNPQGRSLGNRQRFIRRARERNETFRVSITGATGDVRANSVSGDLKLERLRASSVSASTVSGDISNEFGLPVDHGRYVGHNLNGKIGNGEHRLELNSVSGEIKVRRGAM